MDIGIFKIHAPSRTRAQAGSGLNNCKCPSGWGQRPVVLESSRLVHLHVCVINEAHYTVGNIKVDSGFQRKSKQLDAAVCPPVALAKWIIGAVPHLVRHCCLPRSLAAAHRQRDAQPDVVCVYWAVRTSAESITMAGGSCWSMLKCFSASKVSMGLCISSFQERLQFCLFFQAFHPSSRFLQLFCVTSSHRPFQILLEPLQNSTLFPCQANIFT